VPFTFESGRLCFHPFFWKVAMSEASTSQLQIWLEQMNAGDRAAQEALIGHACTRLRLLARKMLHEDFARLRREEETSDVLQGALMRLHRALSAPEVKPNSLAQFFALATEMIRRELLDLSRHHFGPNRPRRLSLQGDAEDNVSPPLADPPDLTYDPGRLLAWSEFHEQVQKLPPEERQVFELLWYHELPQAEAAAMLNVSVPTVKRRWLSARLLLREALAAITSGS
jgi:RNA polymerase sigma-70 factor (ECF subfamily)